MNKNDYIYSMKNKHIKEFNEYINSEFDLTETELLEMANVTSTDSGIDNVVIWIGPNPLSHGYRIKVSNVPNSFAGKNNFVITIPDLKVIGKIDTTFITSDVLNKIKEFVNLNKDIIIKYSNHLISTRELLDSLKKVK